MRRGEAEDARTERGQGQPRAPRRPYRPPRLSCHGRLVDLTRFGGSEVLDSGGGLGQAL